MSATRLVTAAELNDLSSRVIGAAIEVHRELGPGLLETGYAQCLKVELSRRGLRFVAETELPFEYRGVRINAAYKPDFVIENKLIVELKAVEVLPSYAFRQVKTYLKLSGCCLGLLINFGVSKLVDGIERIVHNFPQE
jgi:GxxExxY protein